MSGAAFFAMSAAGEPFSVSVPPFASASTGSSTVTETVQATVSGGVGPFTYGWSIDGDLGVSLVDPTANPVSVRAIGLIQGEPNFAMVSVLVNDTGTGGIVNSGVCSVTFTRV